MAKPDPMAEGILTALGIDLTNHDVVGAVLTWKPGELAQLVVTHSVWSDQAEAAATYAKSYRLVPEEEASRSGDQATPSVREPHGAGQNA